jgi:hypothetical protein
VTWPYRFQIFEPCAQGALWRVGQVVPNAFIPAPVGRSPDRPGNVCAQLRCRTARTLRPRRRPTIARTATACSFVVCLLGYPRRGRVSVQGIRRIRRGFRIRTQATNVRPAFSWSLAVKNGGSY